MTIAIIVAELVFMFILHRELGGDLLITQPELLTMVEHQPSTGNPNGSVITYNGVKIAVKESPKYIYEQLQKSSGAEQ
jgi:hypothetical protein